jgi:hypothetical protein
MVQVAIGVVIQHVEVYVVLGTSHVEVMVIVQPLFRSGTRCHGPSERAR